MSIFIDATAIGKLHYFPVMAKGLPLALIAETSGLKWEGSTHGPDEWGPIKESGVTPFGQMPYLETPDGKVIGQCNAIANYIGRRVKDQNEDMIIMSDMCFAEAEDLYALMQKNNDTSYVKDKVSKTELKQFWTGDGRGTLRDHFANLEKLITPSGFSSSGKTAGEVYLFGMLYQMTLCKADCLNEFTALKSWFDGLATSAAVKNVLEGKSAIGTLHQYFQPYEESTPNYTQDGEVAKEIAAVTPYYPFKKIPRFYDIGGFMAHPKVFQKVVDAYVERYRGMEIDTIGGFDARGFVLGPPIALALNKPFFMLRKPGKMPNTVSSSSYNVEYGKRDGMCISRNSIKKGDRVLLIDDLVATGGTLSSGIELVKHMGGTVVECACAVELKMFIDPPAESGLPSRKKLFTDKGFPDVPVWGLISEDVLTLEGALPEGYVDDGEEH
jgi:adenine phosphoribosyltransferase